MSGDKKIEGIFFWPGAVVLRIKATENVVFLFGFKRASSGVLKAALLSSYQETLNEKLPKTKV